MIKKLRRRFIIVNMSILTCMLFSVLTGIFVYMYSSEVRISYELIESILNEKDIIIKTPESIADSAEIVPNINETASLLSFNGSNNELKNDDNFLDQHGGDVEYKPIPQEPDEPPKPFPEIPEPTMPGEKRQEELDSGSSQSDLSETNSSKPDNNDSKSDDSNIPEDNERDRTDSSVNQNPHIPPADDQPEREQKDSRKNTDLVQTETSVNITSVESSNSKSAEINTTIKVTTENHNEPKPPDEKDFPDPYRGNVKRAYIMVQFDQDDDIDRIVYQYFEDADEEEIKAAAEKIIKSKSDRGKITIGNYKLRYMKKDNPRMMSGGHRLVFLDRTLEISTINRMLFIFIIIGSVGIIVIFGISVLLANWTIKPVDKAWQQQKQFVADASHELKTPLTVISANTDVILSNEDDTVKNQSKWLNYIKEETKRMTKLVNSMLYIAKYDSNELKFAASQFSLSDVLSSICLQFEALVFENGKLLEADIEDNIYIKGDEDKIKQLINILLDNALKYSTENGRINALLSRDYKTGKIRLTVSNTSEYIAPDKLDRLFDRFYRLDDSRNRKTGGSGLGLNIARSITEAHGGEIKAIHENGTTSFTVII